MTIRTNFLKCFAVRAVGNALQPQISVTHQCDQQLNLSQVSNKAASSVDKEKLLKEYNLHRGYPYAALILCTSGGGSGCFKVLWCILSLILGASD